MIAPVKVATAHPTLIEQQFSVLLPNVCAAAEFAFRRLPSAAREEAVQEIVAASFVALVRLAKRGKAHQAFGSSLARYAIAQYRAGRRVGTPMNSGDLMAPGQRRCQLTGLAQRDAGYDNWETAVLEDTKTPVSEQAAFRCDFPAWLNRLPKRHRMIAESLAASHTTGEVARLYKVSPARISQLRRSFDESWRRFHGEEPSVNCSSCGSRRAIQRMA